jgi:hypothetical protein
VPRLGRVCCLFGLLLQTAKKHEKELEQEMRYC